MYFYSSLLLKSGCDLMNTSKEEAEAVKQIHNLELYGNDSTNFLLLDRENGKRVYHGCKKIKNKE